VGSGRTVTNSPEVDRRRGVSRELYVRGAESSDVPILGASTDGARRAPSALHEDDTGNGALEAPKTPGWSSKTAPWYVRNSRWLMAGALLGGICGFIALGFIAWRALGPSPLDEIKVTRPDRERSDPVDPGSQARVLRDIEQATPNIPNRRRTNEGAPRNSSPRDASGAGLTTSSGGGPAPQGVTHTKTVD